MSNTELDNTSSDIEGISDTKLMELESVKHVVPTTPTYDFGNSEQSILDKYMEDGCVGYGKILPKAKDKAYRLYLAGKNYKEIATITNQNLSKVLYISFLYRWTDIRAIYYQELADSVLSNIKNIHNKSIKSMSTVVNAFSIYIEEKFGKYIEKRDDFIIENVDYKLLDKYYKALEVMSKLCSSIEGGKFANIQEPKGKKVTPKEAATIAASATIDIELSEGNSGDVLKNMAD